MITAGGFARFYTPLAATSLLLTATNPILAAALARSPDPVTALAGYSVAFAVCGVLYAPLLVVQQVAAARLLAAGSFSPVKRFAYLSGAVFSLIGALIAYTARATSSSPVWSESAPRCSPKPSAPCSSCGRSPS